MGLLDNEIELATDNTLFIQEWLKDNCEFIGCYPSIHDNIVDIKIDPKYDFQPIFEIRTNDTHIPTDLFRFGECEHTFFKNGKIKPLINTTIWNCDNLTTLNGLPNIIKRLYIRHGKSLNTVEGLPSVIQIIDINDCVETNFEFVKMIYYDTNNKYKIV